MRKELLLIIAFFLFSNLNTQAEGIRVPSFKLLITDLTTNTYEILMFDQNAEKELLFGFLQQSAIFNSKAVHSEL